MSNDAFRVKVRQIWDLLNFENFGVKLQFRHVLCRFHPPLVQSVMLRHAKSMKMWNNNWPMNTFQVPYLLTVWPLTHDSHVIIDQACLLGNLTPRLCRSNQVDIFPCIYLWTHSKSHISWPFDLWPTILIWLLIRLASRVIWHQDCVDRVIFLFPTPYRYHI